MVGDAGRKVGSWLGLTVIAVAGVFAPDMPVHANEYSSIANSDPRLPLTGGLMYSRGPHDAKSSLGIDDTSYGEGVLLIPRDDTAVNQFGIFYINALSKRIEMILTF